MSMTAQAMQNKYLFKITESDRNYKILLSEII